MGVFSNLVIVLAFIIATGFIVFLAFYKEYKHMVRKYKPEYFGLETFQQVTRYQASEWQTRANKKGITLLEWQRLCDEQLSWMESALESRASV